MSLDSASGAAPAGIFRCLCERDGGSGGAEIAIYLGFIILIYLIPSLLAYSRKVPSKLSISILNVFLGWTLIGWVVSLI